LGGWCSQELSGDRHLLVFASFVPNGAYWPGLVPTLVMSLAQKAQWARSHFAPYAADIGLPYPLQGNTGHGRRPPGASQVRPFGSNPGRKLRRLPISKAVSGQAGHHQPPLQYKRRPIAN
jgi:hypothetical protein